MSQFRMPVAAPAAGYYVVPSKFAFGPALDLEVLQAHETVDEAIETAIDTAECHPHVDLMVIQVVGTIKASAE
jgi:hypothetical protein